MQFCIISPASGLQKWATKSKAHLVLSHVTNAMYQQFYRQRRMEGDLVILDNGAYEGRLDSNQLLERVGLYHPTVTVLPDLLGGPGKDSAELSKRFHDKWKGLIDTEWMFVPQGQNSRDFEYCLCKGIEEIRPTWVGIPRHVGTDIGNMDIHTRPNWVRYVHSLDPNVSVHCLGMLAGSVSELSFLADANCASIDSSAPVWRGWNGYDIDDPKWRLEGTDCDFDAPPLTDTRKQQAIIRNLRQCGVTI